MKQDKREGIYAILTGGLMLSTLLIGGVLAASRAEAEGDSATDEIQITVPTACTMTGTVNTAHTATMQAGTYSGTSGIGKTTLTAYCNDYNGFSIYAVGFTGDTYGANTLVGANTHETINTGIYTSSATTSSWSMKVNKVTDSSQSYNPQNMTIMNSFDNWHLVPNENMQVAQYKASTGSSATDMGTGALGAKVETTYDAYVAVDQAADSYEGKVKYTMVHPYNEEPLQPQPSTARCINYFANASNAVGTMGCQSARDGQSKTLLASNFSRTGYGFAGWSDSYDYATNPNAKFYGPNETITVPTGTTANGLSLYAVWVKSEGNLQDTDKVTALCGTNGTGGSLTTAPTDGTANLSSVSALTDQRDNNTYAIARLADGNCWMIENLRLEAEDTRTAEKQALAQGYGASTTYGDFTGLADAESANFTITNPPVANSLYSTDGSTTNTIKGGSSSYYYARMPRYNHKNTNSRASNPTANTVAMYSYGNYYTWAAAMASVKQYTSSTSTDDEGKTSETANTSLCPAGWRLPYGTSSGNGIVAGGFYNLNYKINNDTNVTNSTASLKIRSFPNNFLYSGCFSASSAYDRGNYGIYWSSTVYDYIYSYYLRLDSSSVYPGTDSYYKYIGYSIRCTVSAGT